MTSANSHLEPLIRRLESTAMVHHIDVEALQVRNVASDVEGKYLALALFRVLEAASEAFQDYAGLGRAVAFATNHLISRHVPNGTRNGADGRKLFSRKHKNA